MVQKKLASKHCPKGANWPQRLDLSLTISDLSFDLRVSRVWHFKGTVCTVILRCCKPKSDKKCRSYVTLKHQRIWWGLWNLGQRLQSQKNKFAFFSQNLFSIPRDIPWHHWKNLLTSKRGRSGGLNFFTKFGQIWLKTSGGSRDLNFDRICKCHTIWESSWQTDLIFQEPHDLRGHWRLPEAAEIEKNGPHNFWA